MESRSQRRAWGVVSGCVLWLAACSGAAAPERRADLEQEPDNPSNVDEDREAAGATSIENESLAAQVCDGEPGVSLAAYMAPNYGQSVGAAVTIELGEGFLYVDGSCRYWVWQTHEVAAFRTGSLSATELTEMLGDLAFGEWDALDAIWDGGGADASYQVFYSRNRAFACQGGCSGAPAPARQAFDAGIRWRGLLWEKGTPLLDTPMRVAPFREEAEDPTLPFGHVATPWPFDVPPADVPPWLAGSREPGSGYLVDDPQVAAAIRRERDNAALRHPTRHGLWFGPYEGHYYGFGAREVLPIEDARGSIPRPALLEDWESQ